LIRQPSRLDQQGATALLIDSLGFAYFVICRSEWSDHAVLPSWCPLFNSGRN
jgi:hypothetical protein